MLIGHESSFRKAMNTIRAFMRSKVVSSDGTDQTGLILYNVSTAHNSLRQKGIYVVQGLNLLNAARIREISMLSNLNLSAFATKFGGGGECDISELLFVCNAEFKKTSASYRPRMFIFTLEEDPCGTDRRARKAAITRANDFHEGMGNGAEINLIPLKPDFDIFKFWDQIILYSSGEDETKNPEEFIQSSLIQLEEMNQIILRKIFKKRPLNRVNFSLVPNDPRFNIALMVYTSYFPASKPPHIYVDANGFRPLKSDTRYVSDFTGALVNPSRDAHEVETFFVDTTSKKRVKMTREDLLEMRNWVPHQVKSDVSGSLVLIGFKPISEALQMGLHSVSHSSFLYPQDDRIKGSGMLTSALIGRMIERNLCAICTYIAKSNSAPVLAALIAHGEVFDPETKRQEQSPGFFLIQLPFVEDVRTLSLPDTNVAHVMGADASINSMRLAQVEAAKKIVRTVSEEEWEPSILDNPALQQCYVSLEAMALNLDADQVGSVQDLLSADPQKIDEIANLAVGEWLAALRVSSTEACALGSTAIAPKREYIKAEVPETARFSLEQVRELNAAGHLGRLTVVDMKAIINTYPEVFKNVTSNGRKPELMEKIRLNI